MGNTLALAPKPSIEDEIVIKCPLEVMIRSFFQDSLIIWHDPSLNSEENQQYMAFIKRFCDIQTFQEWQKAKDYIKNTKAFCHVMTSGTNGEVLVKEIHEIKNVSNIYIFCRNKEYHSTWAKNYRKISCVLTEVEHVLYQFQQNLLEWYKKASSLKLSLPAFAPIFNESDKSQINHLHRFLKVIPNFTNRQQAKNDFVNLSKMIYSGSMYEKDIRDFEKNYSEYNKEGIFRWYTKESFLYKVTNNCLRIATSDSIQYCRLLLKDLEKAIKEQYQTKSKSFNGMLYRGSYLSQGEWSSLKANTGREIEMHGFLSASKEQTVALNFLEENPSQKVLITILVPKGPAEEKQGFAEIEEFSELKNEKEILFNVRSRFTVLETEDQHSKTLPYRHLVLLYGAQGLRRFLAEQNPVQKVSIPNAESISCSCCKVKIPQTPERLFFMPIKFLQNQFYYCKKCAEAIKKCDSPLLLCNSPPSTKGKLNTKQIKGCLLMNSSPGELSMYGYKCSKCQIKKQKRYYLCTDCGEKERIWCENCFETTSSCMKDGHNMILETKPFSFWCEKMTKNEMNHLKSQDDLVTKGDKVFQQADMYFESHEYKNAIKYLSTYIQQNETKKDVNLANSYNKIGLVFKKHAEYKKALECFVKSLDIMKSIFKENSHEVATSYNNIASVYADQGDYKKALEYYLKSRNIHRSIFGENHLLIAGSHNNVGVIYSLQGEYKKALDEYFKSLSIRKAIYEENHYLVAASYNNIGLVFNNQGNYEKALECHLKSLDIRKSIYGENHPDVATSYNNLGSVYDGQGEYKKAHEHYLKSLNIKKLVHRENHPDVATSYNNIGLICQTQGDFKKALENHLKSLEIRKSIYGENHPDIATSFNNLGSLHDSMGQYKEAEEYHSKSLMIYKLVHGENHPDIATSYNNIGMVYINQGKYQDALEYHLKSLNIRKSVYGENHPDVATSYNNLGSVYDHQGEYKKALENYLKSLDIRKSVYGSRHPDVATSENNIGLVYYNQGEYDKALDCYWRSLGIYQPIYGENHPRVATSYNNVGSLYESQGEYNKALEYSLKALNIKKSVYGENHPSIATSLNNIGSLYESQGEYKEAVEYYSKALQIYQSVHGENHPEVAISSQNLGLAYTNQQNHYKALDFHLKALNIYKSLHGQNHSDTANALLNVAITCENLKVSKMALKYYSEYLEIQKCVYGTNHPNAVNIRQKIQQINEIDQKRIQGSSFWPFKSN